MSLDPNVTSIAAMIAALLFPTITAYFGWRMSRRTNGRFESLEERLLRENKELSSALAQCAVEKVELYRQLAERPAG